MSTSSCDQQIPKFRSESARSFLALDFGRVYAGNLFYLLNGFEGSIAVAIGNAGPYSARPVSIRPELKAQADTGEVKVGGNNRL
jgi:hypothetical protein